MQWYRSNVGLIAQDIVLFDGTIAENIKYGNETATNEQIQDAAKQANAHNFISTFPGNQKKKKGLKLIVGAN